MKRNFDLNIEKILEDWEVYHGIREIIANAIDEQKITNTTDIEIYKDKNNRWHIRDFGRGIKYEHLTQKEDEEKLSNPNLIGKFGIGLKDALATFDRNGVEVLIESQFGDITIEKSEKHGFEEILTLHAIIDSPSKPNIVGTDVILSNISELDIQKAKSLFLRFSGETLIESTEYGEIYTNHRDQANIYINGVKVAEEENFLFTYNITSLTKKIRKALNRERTNVGRNAYRDRTKMILMKCESEEIAKLLINDLQKIELGRNHDELTWIDVQQHAVKILNVKREVIFVTSQEIQNHPEIIDDVKHRNLEIITIPNNLREKIYNMVDLSGKPIRDLDLYVKEDRESFEFIFINPEDLNEKEQIVINKTGSIFNLIGGKPKRIKNVKISETMRKDPITFRETDGLWDSENGNIVIKREVLSSLEKFGGTLLHETAHCLSKNLDVSRDFELELTRIIGLLVSKNLE